MSARLLDGTAVAAAIREAVAAGGRRRSPPPRGRRAGGLGIVLVGDDPASEIYVRNKVKAGAEAGLRVDLQRLPATATLDELLALVGRLNASDDARRHSRAVAAARRDGEATPRSACSTRSIRPRTSTASIRVNVGRLVQGRPHLAPCTPSGVIEMLDRSGIAIAGDPRRRHRPQRDRRQADGDAAAAARRHGHDLPFEDARPAGGGRDGRHPRRRDRPRRLRDARVRQAGRDGRRRRDQPRDRCARWSRRCSAPDSPRLADFEKRGSVVVGDVHPAVADVAGALTPVPGGVGPLTIAMLLKNTLTAAEAPRGVAVPDHAAGGADRRHRDAASRYCLAPLRRARRRRRSTPTCWRATPSRPARPAWRRGRRALRRRRPAPRRHPRSRRARRASSSPTAPRAPSSRRSFTPRCYRRIGEWFASLPGGRRARDRRHPAAVRDRPASTTSIASSCAPAIPTEQLRRVMARDDLDRADAARRASPRNGRSTRRSRAPTTSSGPTATFAETEAQISASARRTVRLKAAAAPAPAQGSGARGARASSGSALA